MNRKQTCASLAIPSLSANIRTINYKFSDLSLTFISSKCESVLALELSEADMEFTELDRNALYDIWM
ncbi:hypothetical protein R7Z49_26450, partial [Vibrio sp. 1562]|nr:hypothetical protein [Vibrio sp. 1562]